MTCDKALKAPSASKVKRPPKIAFKFPFSIYGEGKASGATAYSSLELNMMNMSAALRSKPNWWEKFRDPVLRDKWRKEALAQLKSDSAVEYVLQELTYYNSLRIGGTEMSAVHGVWQGDFLIPDNLKVDLLNGVSPLEDVPEAQKDWHPGSNLQVLDLVHPSLFCLRYGVSRTVPLVEGKSSFAMMTQGSVINSPPQKTKRESLSTDFAWLPSEFLVHEDGHTTIESYINNLHPVQHAGLYKTIASIFDKFVPMFESVLSAALKQYVRLQPAQVKKGVAPIYTG